MKHFPDKFLAKTELALITVTCGDEYDSAVTELPPSQNQKLFTMGAAVRTLGIYWYRWRALLFSSFRKRLLAMFVHLKRLPTVKAFRTMIKIQKDILEKSVQLLL